MIRWPGMASVRIKRPDQASGSSVRIKGPGSAAAGQGHRQAWEAKKTRPPAEYDAHAALPCPDIEIGSRHPVAA